MPRPLVFGNGRLLVQIDHRGNIRDLSWPIGIWNHLSGRAIRPGIWADGHFAWLDSFGWEREHRYLATEPGLVGEQIHVNAELGVRVTFTECLEDDRDHFCRKVQLDNLRDQPRDVRVFFAHDIRIMEGDIGDCVLWHPGLAGIVHFKGPCAVLLRAEGSSQYACGITDFGGMEGTWRDAEDGNLSGNPIAQGSVDSTLGVNRTLAPHGTAEFLYEIAFADSMDELERMYPGGTETVGMPTIGMRAPDACPGVPGTSIKAGADAAGGSNRIEPTGSADFAFNIAIIASQTSETGAILAANDSDIMATNRANYSYCWLRDGSQVAHELLLWGQTDATKRFLKFAIPLLKLHPYFLQKYRADGTLGATWHPWTVGLPIQLDETASFISLVTECIKAGIPLTEEERTQALKGPVKFLLEYVEDGLPKPSYDLWEERRGVHAYTVATVIRGLRDAAQVADTERDLLNDAAQKMADNLVKNFWNKAHGVFQRSLDDTQCDASTLHIGLLAALPIDDERVQANAKAVKEALWVKDGIGGLARYPGDYYFRVNNNHPGNPWIITTLWLAQHEILSGRRQEGKLLLDWATLRADPTGILPEQCHPESGAPLSVSPLTWSHGEVLKTLRLLKD